jgi:hypothetical protein
MFEMGASAAASFAAGSLVAIVPGAGSFLVNARSVPDVIESCFGHDNGWPKEVKDWFKARPSDERQRRKEFSKQFKSDRDLFRDHHLTKARNVAVHRRGFPPVKGVVIGLTGKPYPASPIVSEPSHRRGRAAVGQNSTADSSSAAFRG